MFAASKTDSVSGAAPDGQFNYVTMLLHGDGTNGGQNNTFLDSSTNNFTITRNGNTTQGSFSPYGSNWSNFFDGTGDYLSIADNAALDLSTLDFTIECWVFPTTGISDVDGVISKRSTSTFDGGDWRIAYSSANTAFGLAAGSNNTDRLTPTITLNAWNHIAFVRESGTLSCYANGTRGANLAWTTNLDNAQPLLIGLNVTGYDFPGYISNVRIVKGTAVYSGSTYTVPTTPLTAITNTSLLTCQSNRFIDNSASPLTITVNGTPSVQRFNPFGTSTAYSTSVIGGSGYFDGSGDSLTVAASSAFAFGSGNFSVQFWVYFTASTADNQTVVELRPMRLIIGRKTTNKARIYVPNTDQNNGDNGPIIPNNAWTHFSVARTGTTMYVYINGVSAFSFSSTDTFNSNPSISIGRNDDLAEPMIGYVSDVRILKGTYDVTLPTAPYTAITNTSLLLSMTNGAIFDNAMMNDLETVGNAQISTSVKKYGTGSLAFDGSGDWLIMPYGPTQNFGTGAFTIEGWFYLNSLAASYYVPAGTWGSGTSDEWLIQIQNNGSIRFLTTSGSTFYSASITTATWYHIAVVRSGSTVTIYVNGTSVGSYTCSNSLGSVSKTLYIGSQAGTWDWNGYIDDFRITNGFARYTATFTPPTSALSDKGPN